MPGTPPPPPPPFSRLASSLDSAHSPAWTEEKHRPKEWEQEEGRGGREEEREEEEGASLAIPLAGAPTPPSPIPLSCQEWHRDLPAPHTLQQAPCTSQRPPPLLPASRV